MKKTGLVLGALLVSLNCYAASLGTEVKSALTNSATSNSTNNSTMIYGGQDISRHQIASADQSARADLNLVG